MRNGKAYIGAFMDPRSKAKLIAVARLRGQTMTQLLEAFAERADSFAALLPAPGKGGRNVEGGG